MSRRLIAYKGQQQDLTPNQIASANLRRLRKEAGMSQERLADLVSHFGLPWTVFTVSDAELALERMAKGRRFTLDEIVVLALIFYVTPADLMLPPADNRTQIAVGNVVLSRDEYLFDVLLRPAGVAARFVDGSVLGATSDIEPAGSLSQATSRPVGPGV